MGSSARSLSGLLLSLSRHRGLLLGDICAHGGDRHLLTSLGRSNTHTPRIARRTEPAMRPLPLLQRGRVGEGTRRRGLAETRIQRTEAAACTGANGSDVG